MKHFHVIILFLCLSACASLPQENSNSPHKLFSAERYHETDTLKQSLDLGVALSGGGIRSSVFSIGVLKALYDAEILDEVDVYSFASGGGYAGYWLMSTEVQGRYDADTASADKPFGYYAFDDTRFTVNACEFMTKSNFVDYRHVLGAWVAGIRNPGDTYQEDIERTYGWFYDQPGAKVKEAKDLTQMQLTEYKKYLEKGLPYFIYTMTVQKPEATYGLTDGHFEMTPVHYGNDSYGFSPWDPKESLLISRAAAISGAAVASVLGLSVLEQPVEVELGKCTDKGDSLCDKKLKQVTLSDGGHSENLAILPLLRRNVETIIAVDAEHDENQIFEGFYKLKDRLQEWGYIVSELALDSRLKLPREKDEWGDYIDKDGWWKRTLTPVLGKSVLTVTVQHEDASKNFKPTTIHYIKMSRNDSRVYKAYLERWRDPGLKGDYEFSVDKTIHARIRKFLEDNEDPRGNWMCAKLASENYCGTDWVIDNAIIRMSDDFDAKFPTHTTLDQSFFIDQTLSYIGLGYLLGSDLGLERAIKPKPHCANPGDG
jgi:hypothetical protein